MDFCSTRNSKISVSSSFAIFKGLANDGGLFAPKVFPKITEGQLSEMLEMDYRERANTVLSMYLTDFSQDEIGACTSKAYAGNFESAAITPTVYLDKFAVCELWHGPTCAFKDVALQILPHLLTTAAKKCGNKDEVVILVATSGDTGKAALEGFKDVDGTRIIVFYPNGGVSDVQRLQMTTQEGKNVCVYAIDGNFDDAQSGVKKLFGDADFASEMKSQGFLFSSANSINFGRLVPQVVYYFSSYLDMVKSGRISIGERVNFAVPTGNFGNILAGYYAKQMGLPVNKFICASNKNNVLTDFINSGVYDKNRDFYLTTSPSMDILVSSNLERLLFHISGQNSGFVAEMMQKLANGGKYEVSQDIADAVRNEFFGGFATEEETAAAIRATHDKNHYLIDPHTAVAVAVYEKYVKATGDKTPTVIMSTASPFKFCRAVNAALGEKISENDRDFALIKRLERFGFKAPAQLATLENKNERFTQICSKEQMRDAVKKALK